MSNLTNLSVVILHIKCKFIKNIKVINHKNKYFVKYV